ncbi:MAG: hypothetical protein AAF732_12135 [Pseudomonadota bacterium]
MISAVGETLRKRAFQHQSLVVQSAGRPEFPRVLEEAEGEFELLLKAAGRSALRLQFLDQFELLAFELGQLPLLLS